MYKMVKLEESASHYTIILHRPDKLNALTPQLIKELHQTLSHLMISPWKLILLKGSGTSFSTGHDVSTNISFDSLDDAQNQLKTLQEITKMITNYPVPVISAIHGYALGAGFEIALNCDLIYAANDATFGFPELEVGLSITQGTSYFLPRIIGLPKAKELIFFSKNFTANTAQEMGLINKTFTNESLFSEVINIIETLNNKSIHALKE